MAASSAPAPAGAQAAPATADLGMPLKQIIDQSVVGTTYVCEAAPGSLSSAAVWRIQKIVVASGITTIGYAGTGAFDQVADNRASLTY